MTLQKESIVPQIYILKSSTREGITFLTRVGIVVSIFLRTSHKSLLIQRKAG